MKKPQHYYCHRTPSQSNFLPEGYEFIEKIGEGAFGEVFKVFNRNTSNIEVMKCTKGDTGDSFTKESEIMKTMKSSDGFAKIHQKSSGQDFLVMTLLGDNLDNVMDRAPLNIVDMKRIGYQCLQRLRQLHERGYVHRDLKPENVLLGNKNNPHKIYLVDFGLSTSFKRNSKHARKIYNGELGTIKFCPLASHLCLEQFPKDDLESLGYLLIFILHKELPWTKFPKGMGQRQKFDQIKRIKEETPIETLCQGVGCLKKYFKIVKELTVTSPINYQSLLELFYIQCKEDYCFSFCGGDCSARRRAYDEGKQNQIDEGLRNQIKRGVFTINKSKK